MRKIRRYMSPIGVIVLESDSIGLTGLWFDGQKYFPEELVEAIEENEDCPILSSAFRWLDIYFSGKIPDFTPPLHIEASQFRTTVCEELLNIPYGNTASYSELAKKVAVRLNKEKMSARAVGGAVGHNRISLIIPCHRIIGADGSLTGYAGGIERKSFLLRLEGVIK